MQYRLLSKGPSTISLVGVGTWAMGGITTLGGKPFGWGPSDDNESLQVLRKARERGITFFDTADVYGIGRSESLLGAAFGGNWAGLHIATKAGNKEVGGLHVKDFTRSHLVGAAESSLTRLKKDSIDLFLLHNPPLTVINQDDWLEAMTMLVSSGKIRFFGASVSTTEEANRVLDRGTVDALEVAYNLLRTEMSVQVIPRARAAGVSIIARVPLQYGLLTGKYLPHHKFSVDDHRQQTVTPSQLQLAQAVCRTLVPIAGQFSLTISQFALRFVASTSGVTSAIPGTRTTSHLDENIVAADALFTPQELRSIRTAVATALDE